MSDAFREWALKKHPFLFDEPAEDSTKIARLVAEQAWDTATALQVAAYQQGLAHRLGSSLQQLQGLQNLAAQQYEWNQHRSMNAYANAMASPANAAALREPTPGFAAFRFASEQPFWSEDEAETWRLVQARYRLPLRALKLLGWRVRPRAR